MAKLWARRGGGEGGEYGGEPPTYLIVGGEGGEWGGEPGNLIIGGEGGEWGGEPPV
jgi:hypothetical protein